MSTAATSQTAGTSSAGQSALDVNLGNLDVSSLAGAGAGAGFDLTVEDTNNPDTIEDFTKNGQQQQQQQQTQVDTTIPTVVEAAPVEEAAAAVVDPAAPTVAATPDATTPETPPDIATLIRTALLEVAPVIGANQAAAARELEERARVSSAPPKELTPEELDKQFDVVRLKPEDLLALGIEASDPARARLEGLLHAAARMGAKIAGYRANDTISKLEARLAPVLAANAQQQVGDLKTQFHTSFPDLKDHEPLTAAVYAQLKNNGFQGTNEQWFAKVGEATRKIVAQVKASPNAVVAQPSQQQQQQQKLQGTNTTHRMSTLSGGGQGGTAGATKADAKAAEWKVWED